MATKVIIDLTTKGDIREYLGAAINRLESAYTNVEKGFVIDGGTNIEYNNYLTKLNKLIGDLDGFLNGKENDFNSLEYLVKLINKGK